MSVYQRKSCSEDPDVKGTETEKIKSITPAKGVIVAARIPM